VQALAHSSRLYHGVDFELRTRWAPNVGINSQSYLFPNMRVSG
jgi:hypothetical protein